MYDLTTKELTELKLPNGWSPSGWSKDGDRLLVSIEDRGTLRVAWAKIDGTGLPDFITSPDEVAYAARLSPDGQRILLMAGPFAPKGESSSMHLTVIDLTTKRRMEVGRPGFIHGHCWSSDGSKIAYTWQRFLDKPAEVNERQTWLVTCELDGSHRKSVTKRTTVLPENVSGREGNIIFFRVLAWQR
jgi:Tol biopolymer transport system component